MIHNIEAQSNQNYLTAAQRVRSALLGNNTKSAATSQNTPYKRHLYDLLKTASDYLPNYRVASCQKVPVMGKNPDGTISEASCVSVGQNDDGNCKFGGLGYCGSIWLCPLCARTVAPTRVSEIRHAMTKNAMAGGQSVFVTFTQPHYKSSCLKKLIEIQAQALTKMKSSREYKKLINDFGFIGEIRAFEITHGSNGWHPHIHAVYLFDSIRVNKSIDFFSAELSRMWCKWVPKCGGSIPSDKHGVDVKLPRVGDDKEIASYIGKWGEELTLSHTKEGKNGSRTPFQILDECNKEYTFANFKLLSEYAAATKGRARLFWSRGLKDYFGVDDFSDSELAERPPKKHLFDMTWAEYKAVRLVGLCGDILDLSEKYPVSVVRSFITQVVAMYNSLQEEEDFYTRQSRKLIKDHCRLQVREELHVLGLLN